MVKPTQVPGPRPEADQTARLQVDTQDGAPSIRIGFTDQRLTAHGGMIVWSHFLRQERFCHQRRAVLPHAPTSPNVCDPSDVALGYLGGILCGADKLSRVALVEGRNWHASAAILDSQSVKSTEVSDERGYDTGKKVNGRKRRLLVDTLGLILMVMVLRASIQDPDGAKQLLAAFFARAARRRVKHIWAAATPGR